MAPSDRSKDVVTMRDVARVAGVSRMTVSRALRDDSPVSKETRERILSVVREMNYVPDQLAGSLTTRKTGFVAALVPSLNNLHFAETVQSLTEELERAGMQILLGYTNYSQEREEKLVEAMLRRRPEAIVLSYDGHSDRTIALLSEARVPVIELWERPEEPLGHTIGFSNKEAAAAMTRTLFDAGYNAITFLSESGDDWTRGAARRAGFSQAMMEAGHDPKRVFRGGKPPMSIEEGAASVEPLLAQFPDTDCIFCVSDNAAFGAQSALLAMGKSVPNEFGVAGFGNFEISRFATPSISTVVVDGNRIGSEAGRLIGELLAADSSQTRSRQIDIIPTPTMRDSTKRLI